MYRLTIAALSAAGVLFLSYSRPAEVPGGRAFPSADAAAWALINAARSNDVKSLMDILGPAAADIASGDPVADRKIRRDFAAQAGQQMKLVARDGRRDEMTLLTGKAEWPLPIAIVEIESKWYFATGQSRHRRPKQRSVEP